MGIFKLKKINFTAKTAIFLKDVDIEKVFVSNKKFLLKTNCIYLNGYLYNDHKVKPIHIMFPKTSAYVKCYDGQIKWMYFLIKLALIYKKEFDSQLVYNEKFLKTKVKSHGDEITDFYDKKIPKIDSNHICLTVITLDLLSKKE